MSELNLKEAEAWGAYLTAMQARLRSSWSGAVAAYQTLKKTRADLGYPFMLTQGGEGAPNPQDQGAWDTSLENNAVDLAAMVKVVDEAITDALNQKRKLYYDQQRNDYAIESKPGDPLSVVLNAQGYPQLLDANGNPTHVAGTVGLAPIVIFGIAAVGAVTFVGAGLVVIKTVDAVRDIAEQKTMQTAITKQAELVASGKATPEQASAMTKAVYGGAAQLNQSKAELEKAKNDSGLGDTIKTVAYVGLGVGVLYVLAQFIKTRPGGAASPAMLENPIRYIGDARVNIKYDGYVGGHDKYSGTVSAGGKRWKFDELYAPAGGFPFAYDSPEAYDKMAASAVGFGSYYTTHNRPPEGDPDLEGYPSAETADAISDAAWDQDDRGEYNVRRRK